VKPKIYHATDHEIDHSLIDSDALYVINKLKGAGFVAYLVGGGVRDILAKKFPKDFDISTSARPEQIKQLFSRNCLLIGRRFRLAHVRFGRKIIEVSTFRSGENESDLIIHDNQWGSPEEDVMRRDFTINGLFYDPSTHTVIDYVGGWDDIHQKILRTIGNPFIRFKQDPVRMIRLLKFQARFNFDIVPEAKDALYKCKEEIIKSSPARILEEIFRMLESGYSSPFFHLMTKSGILELLFPCLTHFLEGKHGEEVYAYLASADQLNAKDPKNLLDRSLLISCLLYPILEHELRRQYLDKGVIPHIGEIMLLTSSLIKGFVTSSFSHFPKRHSSTMGFILATQFRLTPPSGKRHPRPKVIRNKEFSLALTFLQIRSLVDQKLVESYQYWKDLLHQMDKHGSGERKHHHNHSTHPEEEF
jgi:poly(A) polymerase